MRKVKIELKQFIKEYKTTEGDTVKVTTTGQCPVCMKSVGFYRDAENKDLIVIALCEHDKV